MKYLTNSIPTPICCTALGFAGLGILLKSSHPIFMAICGMISFSIILLVFLKLILNKKTIQEIFSDPAQAGAFAAFPMTFMLLSVYLSASGASAAGLILWVFSILLHILIILIFSIRYIHAFQIRNVHGTWFIVYIGIAASSIAAPAHGMQHIALPLLYFAMACLPILLPLVSWRYLKYSEIPENQKPLFCILAAPVSLCLSGYLQSAPVRSQHLTLAMLLLSLFFYIIAALRLITLIPKAFYPSHSAFTFPFVISASAIKQSIVFFESYSYHLKILQWIQISETFIAAFLCFYVLCRFFLFVRKQLK